MSSPDVKDIEHGVDEKGSLSDNAHVDVLELEHPVVVEEVKRTYEIQNKNPVLRQLRRAEVALDRVAGIELQGIDRVPEEAKQPPSIWNVFLLWWSLNVHVGVIPLGLLGAEFGLSLRQNIAASIIGSCLGALCTGYTGTLSPKVSQLGYLSRLLLTLSLSPLS